jgi:hypothetical protein
VLHQRVDGEDRRVSHRPSRAARRREGPPRATDGPPVGGSERSELGGSVHRARRAAPSD